MLYATAEDVAARARPFPFTRIAGQDEMKQALILNVVDPNIGGVLIMGDRGTGKSVAVRCSIPSAASCPHVALAAFIAIAV